jgi:hypothetical protein
MCIWVDNVMLFIRSRRHGRLSTRDEMDDSSQCPGCEEVCSIAVLAARFSTRFAGVIKGVFAKRLCHGLIRAADHATPVHPPATVNGNGAPLVPSFGCDNEGYSHPLPTPSPSASPIAGTPPGPARRMAPLTRLHNFFATVSGDLTV